MRFLRRPNGCAHRQCDPESKQPGRTRRGRGTDAVVVRGPGELLTADPTSNRGAARQHAAREPDVESGRLRISQHQTSCCYIEGQVSHLIVRDGDGKEVVNRTFQTVDPASPVVDRELAPGRYEIESYQQPCNGNCGYLDPPTDRCVQSVAVGRGVT